MTKHPSQGEYKRVLCVCSGGLLRSATAALVLSSPPYDFNTRAAGITEQYALVDVTQNLIDWADEIVLMEAKHFLEICKRFDVADNKCIVLGLTDDYLYRDPKLIEAIKEKYDARSI